MDSNCIILAGCGSRVTNVTAKNIKTLYVNMYMHILFHVNRMLACTSHYYTHFIKQCPVFIKMYAYGYVPKERSLVWGRDYEMSLFPCPELRIITPLKGELL